MKRIGQLARCTTRLTGNNYQQTYEYIGICKDESTYSFTFTLCRTNDERWDAKVFTWNKDEFQLHLRIANKLEWLGDPEDYPELLV